MLEELDFQTWASTRAKDIELPANPNLRIPDGEELMLSIAVPLETIRVDGKAAPTGVLDQSTRRVPKNQRRPMRMCLVSQRTLRRRRQGGTDLSVRSCGRLQAGSQKQALQPLRP